jgi:hypothetical protein
MTAPNLLLPIDVDGVQASAVSPMPQGYYSGDRPNPNLRAFVEAHMAAHPYDPATDDYDVPAFNVPIETTKATAIYNMHTYWSKSRTTRYGPISGTTHSRATWCWTHSAAPAARLWPHCWKVAPPSPSTAVLPPPSSRRTIAPRWISRAILLAVRQIALSPHTGHRLPTGLDSTRGCLSVNWSKKHMSS